MKFFFVPGAMVVIFLFGCVSKRPVIVTDGSIKQGQVYELSSPPKSWIQKPGDEAWVGSVGGKMRDISFLKCPGPMLISVESARYEAPPLNAPNDFESVARKIVQRSYEVNGISHSILESDEKKVGGQEIAYFLIESSENMVESCQSEVKVNRAVLTRFYVYKKGEWGYSYFSKKVRWPALIILSYASPKENHNEGVGDFERMVQSFRFIEK
jgi:hypothetical protein